MTTPALLDASPAAIANAILATMDEADVATFGAELFAALHERDPDMAAAFAVGVADESALA